MVQKNKRGTKRKVAAAPPQPASTPTTKPRSLLWLWGSNCFGQLGFGEDVMERITPTLAKFEQKVVDAAAGGMHTLMLLDDGTLWSSGVNDEGALGRTIEEGREDEAAVPGKVSMPAVGIIQLAATDSASFALMGDGSIYGWGTFRNEHGVFGFAPTKDRQPTPVKVYTPSGRNPPVMKIAAGGNHIVGILKDGGAISWGDGDQGQLGRISLRSSRRPSVIKQNMLRPMKIPGCKRLFFVDVFCGEYSTFLKTNDGRFFAFGLNNSGQLAIPPDAALTNADTITLEDRVHHRATLLVPTSVPSLDRLKIKKVAPGKDHGLAIDETGRLYSWGVPTYGVLGRQDMEQHMTQTTPFPQPVAIKELQDKTIIDAAGGQVISGCIDRDGDLYTWGAELNDMLGYAADGDCPLPKKVPRTQRTQGKKFRRVEFGGQHALAMGE